MTARHTNSTSFEKSLTILHDFYLEFFSIFVPGLILLSLGIAGIVFAACVCFSLNNQEGIAFVNFQDGGVVKDMVSSRTFRYLCALLYLTLSYTVGSILYRKQPKDPDAFSSYKQWCQSSENERKGLAVKYHKDGGRCVKGGGLLEILAQYFHDLAHIFLPLKKCLYRIRRNEHSIDYPYPCMRQYLLKRGMTHLVHYIPWCYCILDEEAGADGNISARSKHVINTIKSCIRISGEDALLVDMVKNESHIRMMTSLWYAFRYLCRICLILEIAIVTALLFSGGQTHQKFWIALVLPIAFLPLSVALISLQDSIHYVRTREIVSILGTAFLLEKNNQRACYNYNGVFLEPEEGIKAHFEVIREKNSEFVNSIRHCKCSQCTEKQRAECRKA